jgi:hypothetical protein
MQWVVQVELVTEERNNFRVLFGKSEGKKVLGRAKLQWEGNVEAS